jgi:hypothetical protein
MMRAVYNQFHQLDRFIEDSPPGATPEAGGASSLHGLADHRSVQSSGDAARHNSEIVNLKARGVA